MKLVNLRCVEAEEIAINSEMIVALVPQGGQTQLHLMGGTVFTAQMILADLIEKLTAQGWRKG